VLTSACNLTPKPPRFCVTRCAQTLTQNHSGFGAAEAGVMLIEEHDLVNERKYPSAEEFFINIPLYEVVEYAEEDLEQGRLVKYFDGTFDSYCPECNSHSIFERHWQYQKHIEYAPAIWVDSGFFTVAIRCTRNRDHKQHFIFHASGQTLQKVGQLPSIANLNLYDVKKYSKVLDKRYFQEFTKAIGLSSHGVGVGSFVYLRRIFEFLIEESHAQATKSSSWNEGVYLQSRMSEKIELLKNELPEFLVENKSMYSILSKGIHELSEQECLAAFPVLKVGIEIVLEQKLENMQRAKKLEEARRAITSLSGKCET
jgi:hypothetical protein